MCPGFSVLFRYPTERKYSRSREKLHIRQEKLPTEQEETTQGVGEVPHGAGRRNYS